MQIKVERDNYDLKKSTEVKYGSERVKGVIAWGQNWRLPSIGVLNLCLFCLVVNPGLGDELWEMS